MADTLLPSETEASSPARADAVVDVPEFAEKPESFGRQAWKRFVSHKLAIIGVFTFATLIFFFWVGPRFVDFEFDEINVLDRAQGPNSTHWFGTDDLGRDLFVRAMTGGRFSITISVITGVAAALLGGIFGSIAGYFGRVTDSIVNFVINMLLTMPAIAILLVLGIKWTITPVTVAMLIAVLSWTRGARVVRALILQFKEREFVLAARAAGATNMRILRRHLLPNIAGALLVEATLLAGTAIILESTLSFLGLGVQPPETTLGTLIADAKGSIDTNPARVLIPGGLVTLIVLSLNFIGDGLRDALDPTHELEL